MNAEATGPRRAGAVFLSAAAACFVAAAATAAAVVALNRGRGQGDLAAFLLWTVPFAAAVAAAAGVVARVLARLHPVLAFLALTLAAAAASVAWTVLVALALGGWIGAFSFPVLPCWLAGAVSGFAAALWMTRRSGGARILLPSALLGIACLAVAFGGQDIVAWLAGEQQLQVVIVQEAPRFETEYEDLLFQQELGREGLDRLRAAGVKGQVRFLSGGLHGRGDRPTASAIVVIHRGEAAWGQLRQPDNARVVYVQDGGAWRMYPPDAPTLDRVIQIELSAGGEGHCGVELLGGGRQGGGIYTHPTAPPL